MPEQLRPDLTLFERCQMDTVDPPHQIGLRMLSGSLRNRCQEAKIALAPSLRPPSPAYSTAEVCTKTSVPPLSG